ncbi:MAG: S-layer homology domain-containing protein, partial [Vallitaleaceae bacterium]|nr:S-layer homology domain-containing protein [Vallitaleaceae bacterium]
MTKILTSIKKSVAPLMIISMMITMVPVDVFAETTSDISNHWAESTIQSWIDQKLIKGYEDGSFKPDNNITRAEFMTLVNRAYGFTLEASIFYQDVAANVWYTSEIAKAKAAGYISGYPDGTMKPEKEISREEVAYIIMKLNKLTALGAPVVTFEDAASFNWSKEAIEVVTSAKIMNGYPDSSFQPANNIKRGEAVVVLDQALSYNKNNTNYSTAGTYGPTTGSITIAGNVIVTEKDTILQNMIINGNLIIGKNVGDGNVSLNNVVVKGETNIYGGGQNSIIIINSTLGKVTVSKENGKIRILITGSTTIAEVQANSGVKLEESNLITNSAGFQEIFIDAEEDDTIILMGTFSKVDIKTPGLNLQLPAGTVVETLVLNKQTAVTGTGTVTKAYIKASGSTFETGPKTIYVAAGVVAPIIKNPTSTSPVVIISSGGTPAPDTTAPVITAA